MIVHSQGTFVTGVQFELQPTNATPGSLGLTSATRVTIVPVAKVELQPDVGQSIPFGSLTTIAAPAIGVTSTTVSATPELATVPVSVKFTVGLFGSFVARESVSLTAPADVPEGGVNSMMMLQVVAEELDKQKTW